MALLDLVSTQLKLRRQLFLTLKVCNVYAHTYRIEGTEHDQA
ncbi:hypothetical protein XACS582_14310002 [Xanthomonas citri pv. citri]|nr:hypothetical protein XAC902_1710008 [Xanthomonas citri pv. citri]CEE28395.1 hypothetical protein XAC2911_1450047 [Xanthomonas citri pv. citri]CEE55873.1 hypothetical protein XACS584_1400006 [Xanthomonas citri pv. citri]CEF22745.1 hypothetical protein XACJK2_2100002 [Xanthomonas citri pv. citri]CEH48990.1 hypothetical protein XAC3615_13820002 [Xanthomonas citri pv. citri]